MEKKQYLCSGFENVKYTLQNPTKQTNLFCTLTLNYINPAYSFEGRDLNLLGILGFLDGLLNLLHFDAITL